VEKEYVKIVDNMAVIHPLEEPAIPEHASFNSGKLIDANSFQGKPLEFNVLYNDGSFPGHFHDSASIPVLSKQFVSMVEAAGIDNFQLFPALILDKENNKQWDEFYAFNAIGLVDVAHEDSEFDEIMPGSDGMPAFGEYDELIFDANKTQEMGMFREVNSSDLYFHVRLLEVLKKNIPPEKWGIKFTYVESR